MRLVISLSFVAAMTVPAAAALAPVSDFGTNPGALDMFEYVPAGLPSGRPIVVVMHGCTQTASAMEVAGWNALADAYKFTVVYPQQRSANQSLTCFTWYATDDISRDKGEAASVIEMVDKSIASHGGDRNRVYITGMSAGGAFVAVMLSAYPDRFRAGSVMSGVPYKCATDQTSGSTCASSGVTKPAEQWGDLARSGDPGFSGTWPRMQIWHGSKDYTVATVNAQELVKQWTNVWGTDADADATDMISGSTRTQYKAGSTVAVELYLVGGMGHAIATGADALGMCPATSGAFFADEKICSTLRAAQFFGLLGDGTGDPGGDGSGSGSGDGSGSDGSSSGGGDGGGCNAAGGSPGLLVAFALLFSGLSAAGSSRPRRAQ